MSTLLESRARTRASLLVTFADLTHFTAECARRDDSEIADALDGFYERAGERIASAGGHVVKFLGDAVLAVFEENDADAGVRALLELRRETDAYFGDLGWSSRLVVKAHFGEVVAGPFGVRDRKGFDVLGSTVNVAATLQARTFGISAEAFRKLSPATRKLFKKHTPPISYIPLDDPRP